MQTTCQNNKNLCNYGNWPDCLDVPYTKYGTANTNSANTPNMLRINGIS